MVIVNVFGLLLIAAVIGWAWVSRPMTTSKTADQNTVIEVENGRYSPAQVSVDAGGPRQLAFLRKDASPCTEKVQFPELEIIEDLPLNKIKKVALPRLDKGKYRFHCQMQMYNGVVIIK